MYSGESEPADAVRRRESAPPRIFHVRLPGFEIQSERILDSSLKSRALAIISSCSQGGTLLAVSPEAEQEGLAPGLSVDLARRISARTLFMPYNKTLYDRVNRYVNEQIIRYSPIVEPEDLGRYYLDMRGSERFYRGIRQAAFQLNRSIRDSVSLKGRVAISSSKLVSSISTQVTDEEIFEVVPGTESAFLDPLPPSLLPSAREQTLQRLFSFLMFRTIGELRILTEDRRNAALLLAPFTDAVYREARGEDDRPVTVPKRTEHITGQLVLNSDTNDIEKLTAAVRRLAEQTAYELRKRGRSARSFSLEIHYNDGFRKARRGTLSENDNAYVTAEALALFEKANERRNRIRSLLTDAWDLQEFSRQMNMFDLREPVERRISETVDLLRNKYGFESIMSAAGLYRTEALPGPARRLSERRMRTKTEKLPAELSSPLMI